MFFLLYIYYCTKIHHMDDLTPAQKRVLAEYTRRAEEGRGPPTLQELCDTFGWKSRNGARSHVLVLMKKGKLTQDGHHKPRSVALQAPAVVRVPRVKGVGTGAKAMEPESEIPVPAFLAPDDDGFALQIDDNEMEGASLKADDIVVARNATKVMLGNIAVVEMGGRLVVRRIESDGGAGLVAATRPMRGAASAVPLKHVKIRGIVRSLLRHYPDPKA